jgi:hypothetical protein
MKQGDTVHKNEKVSVRVSEVRNKLKRDCEATLGQPKVCSFSASELQIDRPNYERVSIAQPSEPQETGRQ